MQRLGIRPEIFTIETVDDWREGERFWIAYYRSIGCRLVNTTFGGDGLSGANSKSFKRGQRPANAGMSRSLETRKKIADANRRRPHESFLWTNEQKLSHRSIMKRVGNTTSANKARDKTRKSYKPSLGAKAKWRASMQKYFDAGWSPAKGKTPWNKGKKGVQKMPKWSAARRAKHAATIAAKRSANG